MRLLDLNPFCLFFVFLAVTALAPTVSTTQANSRESLQNAVSLEVLGRTIIYGVQYDRSLGERLSMGASLSHVSIAGDGPSTTVGATWVLPVFGTYFLSSHDFSPFLTAGITYLSRTEGFEGKQPILGGARLSSFPFWGTLGAGYEVRQASGFFFRGTGLLILSKSLSPAISFNLGYAF